MISSAVNSGALAFTAVRTSPKGIGFSVNFAGKDIEKEETSEKTPQEERLERDFQLARAVDLIKGIDIYKESLSQ